MRPINAWAHLMSSTITVAAKASDDRYGKPTYGAAVTYVAHLSKKRRQVSSDHGQQLLSEKALYLNGSAAVLPTARVTLSTADVGSTEEWAIHPPIIAVERRFDQVGAHHVVVYLG